MIIEKLYKNIDKQRNKVYNQYVNRISSIGFPCTRKLVYDITRRDAIPPVDAKLQVIFNEGKRQENIIKRDLLEVGIELHEQETQVSFLLHRLFGHIDGTLLFKRVKRVVEIKTMSCYVFDKINTPDDFNQFVWHMTYIPQINLYMEGMKLKKGIFILKNKNTGELKEILIELDKTIVKENLAKCLVINDAVDDIKHLLLEQYQIKEIADFDKKKDFEDYIAIKHEACQKIEELLPARINKTNICENCPFNVICLPDEIRQAQARVLIDTELETKLLGREVLIESKKLYDNLDKEIKNIVKESGYDSFICGDFEITVNRSDKRTTVNIEKFQEREEK